jgi:hypothetical protein
MTRFNFILLNSAFVWIFMLSSCVGNQPSKFEDSSNAPSIRSNKINGIALTAPGRPVGDSLFISFKRDYANWVCLLPFAFVPFNKPEVYYNAHFQMWGERTEGIMDCANKAHAQNMKVMLKPQLWIGHGEYTGSLNFQDSLQWKSFENSYSNYILKMAAVADSCHVDLLCIGTELNSFINLRCSYWMNLIDSVRKVYHGKLTYAENWDCYARCALWTKLDYIGVNAYFPLCTTVNPSLSELKTQWIPFVDSLKNLSVRENKPVLFTEYGYRSIDACSAKPYESYSRANSNYEAQRSAFEALFESCWNQPWFAGGFAWKWFDSPDEMDMPMEIDYCFQGKPAEQVLRKWYKNEE